MSLYHMRQKSVLLIYKFTNYKGKVNITQYAKVIKNSTNNVLYKVNSFCHLIMICHLNSFQFTAEGLSFTSYKFQPLRLHGFFKRLSNAIFI